MLTSDCQGQMWVQEKRCKGDEGFMWAYECVIIQPLKFIVCAKKLNMMLPNMLLGHLLKCC